MYIYSIILVEYLWRYFLGHVNFREQNPYQLQRHNDGASVKILI